MQKLVIFSTHGIAANSRANFSLFHRDSANSARSTQVLERLDQIPIRRPRCPQLHRGVDAKGFDGIRSTPTSSLFRNLPGELVHRAFPVFRPTGQGSTFDGFRYDHRKNVLDSTGK
jgi:hypothetical protein